MKTTFSYFQGMFKNPAPSNYYFKKQNQKYYEYELYTNASKNNNSALGSNKATICNYLEYSIHSYTNSVLF